jgi:hypothetical protein
MGETRGKNKLGGMETTLNLAGLVYISMNIFMYICLYVNLAT